MPLLDPPHLGTLHLGILHLGPLHPVEQTLVFVLAFGPFVVLAAVVWWTRRRDRREDPVGPEGR